MKNLCNYIKNNNNITYTMFQPLYPLSFIRYVSIQVTFIDPPDDGQRAQQPNVIATTKMSTIVRM